MSSLFFRDISHLKDGVSRGDKEFLIKDDESISFSVAIAFHILGFTDAWLLVKLLLLKKLNISKIEFLTQM